MDDYHWPKIPRPVYQEQLRRSRGTDFVKVLTGIRRSGKSTILRMFIEELRGSGVSDDDIVYINFDIDQETLPADSAELTEYVNKRLTPGRGKYLFFDEIQNVKEWEIAVTSFYEKHADVYITGSNSQTLSSDLATKLSGRTLGIHVMPLSFSEYMVFRKGSGMSGDELLSDYIRDGGLPAVALLKGTPASPLIRQILEGVYGTVYRKDIDLRYQIRNQSVMENIIRFMMRNIGSRTSPGNIAGKLSSRRIKVAVATVEDYMDYIAGAYLMYRSQRIDSDTGEYMVTSDKFYASDLGVRNVIAPMREGEMAGLIENVVFSELMYRYGEVATYDVDGKEIDFIADPKNRPRYFQVCMSIADDATRERELKPLKALGDNYPKTVITLERFPSDDIDGIRIVSLTDWMREDDWMAERFPKQLTHDQHFVSQFYLGRFGKDGIVYGYDIRRHKGKPKGTGGWCKLYDFYEIEGLEPNELEGRFADIEDECAPYLGMMSRREALEYDDMLPVLRLASMTHVRSPAMLQSCLEIIGGDVDSESGREAVMEACKRTILTGLRSAEGHLFGIPYGELAISYQTWDQDVLVTTDNPVIPCNLYDLSFIPRQGILDGFIFPVDMRTLVMVFRVSDHERFEEAFGKAGGLIDPQRANYIMIENAVGTVFFKDDSNPIFSVIDQIPLNPAMEDVYEFLQRELQESEKRKRKAKEETSSGSKG